MVESPKSQAMPQGPRSEVLGETELFGLLARGTQFVYVIDRSGSMSELSGRPMAAAKRELQRSLNKLQDRHQFQIIFYNELPRAMQLPGVARGMIWATEENRRRAVSFVDSIRAQGGTNHVSAIQAGLAWNPDVLFLLTDADRPQLTQADYDHIAQRNQGTRIYAVEFGRGPSPASRGILQRLAQESGGEFVYLDLLLLPEQVTDEAIGLP